MQATSTDQKHIYSWAMYDWANSAFATTIMASVLPAYFSKVAAANLTPATASSYWGYTNTIAMLTVALSAPILGAIADYMRAKIKFLAAFAILGMLATAMLFSVQQGDWLLASFFYIIGRIGFSSSVVFYDSLLPHISDKTNIDRVSTLGYALGYLGGGLLLALNIAMILWPQVFFIPDSALATRWCFITVALWWGLFSLPLWINVKEPLVRKAERPARMNVLRAGFNRIKLTFSRIRQFKQAFRLLIAYWLYNDGIGTIIVMAVIFGSEMGIGEKDLLGAVLLVQFLGIPFTLLFGRLAEKISAKKAIFAGLFIYTGICILGLFIKQPIHFWILAVLISMVMGGTQALSRSLFGLMIPKDRSAEFFGFYDVSEKFSGILGPAIFGVIAQFTGSSRLSILALVLFFVSGMIVLKDVDLASGISAAAQADLQD
jgi:UMF1 family MFS transporter